MSTELVEIGFSFIDTDGCCGVFQVCGFTDDPSYYVDYTVEGKTEVSACKKVFKEIKKHAQKGYIHQIWFVKYKDYAGKFEPHYQREPLRELFSKMKDVLDLGEHVNPNTGNMIQGYQWRAA